MEQSKQLCSFYLDGHLFGLELNEVQEVFVPLEMSPVPLAQPVVSGLINLRGQMVTALDLRSRLQLAPRPASMRSMNVVVQAEDGAVSLLVDEIGDVLQVQETAFEPTPETVPSAIRDLILGVYKLDGSLLHALDLARVCEIV